MQSAICLYFLVFHGANRLRKLITFEFQMTFLDLKECKRCLINNKNKRQINSDLNLFMSSC